MNYFSKLLTFYLIVGGFKIGLSQTGRVGIGVGKQPTENLDVGGTLKVATLPPIDGGKIYTSGEDSFSQVRDQNFLPKYVVTANDVGVLGKKKIDKVFEEEFKESFTTTDDSSALFVIKRYNIGDWPKGQNSGKGFDTGMSVDKWEAFVSGWMTSFSNSSQLQSNHYTQGFFSPSQSLGFRMVNWNEPQYPHWMLIGDMPSVQEKQFLDILFIKKTYVASENRNQ